jgi:hypothetical protein
LLGIPLHFLIKFLLLIAPELVPLRQLFESFPPFYLPSTGEKGVRGGGTSAISLPFSETTASEAVFLPYSPVQPALRAPAFSVRTRVRAIGKQLFKSFLEIGIIVQAVVTAFSCTPAW